MPLCTCQLPMLWPRVSKPQVPQGAHSAPGTLLGALTPEVIGRVASFQAVPVELSQVIGCMRLTRSAVLLIHAGLTRPAPLQKMASANALVTLMAPVHHESSCRACELQSSRQLDSFAVMCMQLPVVAGLFRITRRNAACLCSYEGNSLEDPWTAPSDDMFTRSVSPEKVRMGVLAALSSGACKSGIPSITPCSYAMLLQAPDKATEIEIEFEKGDPVAIVGVGSQSYKSVSLSAIPVSVRPESSPTRQRKVTFYFLTASSLDSLSACHRDCPALMAFT